MSRVSTFQQVNEFTMTCEAALQSEMIEWLESGQVVLLPNCAFQLLKEETQFLTPEAVTGRRKNISYDIKKNKMKGARYKEKQHEQLQVMMKRFAEHARTLIEEAFPDYRSHLQQGRTSFRPVEAATRDNLSSRKDDRLLHVDAFPASPTQGRRILRVFSNINPHNEPRVWRLGGDFSEAVERYYTALKITSWLTRHFKRTTRLTRGLQTPYDTLMLQLHDLMKQDRAYQQDPAHKRVELPANSTWIVYTDQVPHAALSGQFCLEQTFYLPPSAMKFPERSPLEILQNAFSKPLVVPGSCGSLKNQTRFGVLSQ